MKNETFNIKDFNKRAKSSNCLVVGDIILDRYISGNVNRISPEAPIPVVHVTEERYVLGGAANVAGNICGYYMKPYLCGRIGNDAGGKKVRKMLEEKNIEFIGISSELNCTTIKSRVTGMNQQIVRIDEEDCSGISFDEEKELLQNIREIIDQVQVVVLSDYDKGVCTERLCKDLVSICSKKGKFIIVDPKSKDWSKYAGATLITPNFKEFRESVGIDLANKEEDIIKESSFLMDKYDIKNLLVTRSQYGMTLVNTKKEAYSFDTVAQEVFDVSGAGDTVVATIAAFMAAEYSLQDAVEISNQAAGLSVSKVGTYMVTIEEVNEFMSKDGFNLNEKIVSLDALIQIIGKWRKGNNKIVFTNGCFDILHVGHITYLNKARRFGDKLIIGINTDSSVKRLKGDGRPLNRQEDRAILLAALQCVDLVVLFDGDTPYELIKAVKPDVLVKGGDYKPEEVVGREFAGELKLVQFVDGYSTTNIIKEISENRTT